MLQTLLSKLSRKVKGTYLPDLWRHMMKNQMS